MSWRDVKNKARSQVHSTFGLPASYTPLSGPAIPCTVRINDVTVQAGDFDSNNMGQHLVEIPEAIFLVSEVTPVMGAMLAVTDGPTYRVEYVYPVNGLTVKAELSRV